jgi:hypothetical protein
MELFARRSSESDLTMRMLYDDAYRLERAGMDLISYLAGTRVPMAKSLQNFLDKCESIHLRKRVIEGDAAATG